MKFLLINTCYINSNLFFKQYPQIKDNFNVEVFKEKEEKYFDEERGVFVYHDGRDDILIEINNISDLKKLAKCCEENTSELIIDFNSEIIEIYDGYRE